MNKYPWIEDYLRAKPGAQEDFKVEWQWQRFLVRGKMYAAICTPGPEHSAYGGRSMVILKCDPRLAEGFRAEYPDIIPGFYSDKRHWNSVYLDGAVPEDLMRDLCDMSYRLVVEKLPKYVQKELQ